jgi:pimeloyl-ACP methyl ester carboxylesterase
MVDLRGHGRSARIRGRVGVDDLADETAAVMDSLGLGAVDLMGYSLGGMVAQALVRRYPGRVNRLVLAATAARPVWWPRWVTVPVFLLGRAAARFDRLVAPRIAYRYLTRTGAIPAQYGAWLWESLLDRDVDLYYQAGFAILRFDGSDGLRRIDVPTLSIVPTEDQLIPPSRQRETALALQDNRIVEVQGARHEMVMTHPEEVAKAVRGFLS